MVHVICIIEARNHGFEFVMGYTYILEVLYVPELKMNSYSLIADGLQVEVNKGELMYHSCSMTVTYNRLFKVVE